MGNCTHKGVAANRSSIRILMDSGCVMELQGLKIVRDVLGDFPGYGIFRKGNLSSPLADDIRLLGGHFYYLLPLGKAKMFCNTKGGKELRDMEATKGPRRVSSGAASDLVANLANGSSLQVLPSLGNGVWRVKLAIDTKQLEEILSEEVNVEALIERMRMVASSTSLTPKRARSSRGMSWKPTLSNVI